MHIRLIGFRATLASSALILALGCSGSTDVQLAKVPPAKGEPGITTKKEGVPIPKGPSSSGMMRDPLSSEPPPKR